MITTKDGKQKKVIFISVPMHGEDDAVIRRHIQVVKAWYLKATKQDWKDVTFIDNFDDGKPDESFEKLPECQKRIRYLARAIARMSNADIVIFGNNAEKSKGCSIEKRVASAYNIETWFYQEREPQICFKE